MRYRMLGVTEIEVSRICFGALTIGPLQANMSLAEGAAVLRHALEQGVNFIDTAQLYRTYPYIKKALLGWDRPVVIASKSYDYTAKGMKKSLEEARMALNRDVIDIFMLHEQESELTLAGHKPALDYLWEAKARGLVRAVGISTHTVKMARIAAERSDIEVIHPIVNLHGFGLHDGSLAEMLAALKLACQNGKGIYGMKPLGGGNLLGQVKEALEFVFNLPYLHSVAIGCRIKEELDNNICILEGRIPVAEITNKLACETRALYIADWCTGCGACAAKCPQGLLTVASGKARLTGQGCLLCGYCGAACKELAIKIY